jgi:hypothetical protein
VVREAKGLKPRDLLSSDTHVALREWLTRFRVYYEASKFEHGTSDSMKHSYFYACMEDKLAFRVRSAATATSAVLNTPATTRIPRLLETLLREQFDMQDSSLLVVTGSWATATSRHSVHGLDERVHRRVR